MEMTTSTPIQHSRTHLRSTKDCFRVVVCAFLLLIATSAPAAIIGQYAFATGVTSSDSETHTVAGAVAGTSLTTSVGSGKFNIAVASTPGSQDVSKYFSFIVSVNGGSTLNLNGQTLTFVTSTDHNGSGNDHYAVRSSRDGFASNIDSGKFNGNSSAQSLTFSGATFNGLTGSGAIEIRFYVWDNDTGAGNIQFDDIVLNGIVPVPEPANVALMIFGVVCLGAQGCRVWRRAQKKVTTVSQ